MPFYENYPGNVGKFAREILKKYPQHFPELTLEQDKIDGETEQLFLNCIFMLMDDAEVPLSFPKELENKLSEARKRKKQIQSEFFKNYQNSILPDLKFKNWYDYSNQEIEDLSMSILLISLEKLEPPLERSELEMFKKSKPFQQLIHGWVCYLLKKRPERPELFIKESSSKKPTNIAQVEGLIDHLIDFLDVEQLSQPFPEYGIEVDIRPEVLKYLVALKNQEKIARLLPFVKVPDDYDKILEHSLNLKEAGLLKNLESKYLNEIISKLISSSRAKDILNFSEIVIKEPGLMDKLSDDVLANLLEYFLKNRLTVSARKLIILYPEKITVDVLNKIQSKSGVFELMNSAREFGFENAYQAFMKRYSKELSEYQALVPGQDRKEMAEVSSAEERDDLIDGPIEISHRLFSHIQNDHEASGTELQGGEFIENTTYLLKTLRKMRRLAELSKEDYEILKDYFSEVQKWARQFVKFEERAGQEKSLSEAVPFAKSVPFAKPRRKVIKGKGLSSEALLLEYQGDIDELNNNIIKDLYKKKVVRIPGGYSGSPGHAMLYELSLEGEDVVFKIINTGDGLVGRNEEGELINNHLSQESSKLTRYAPAVAYRFPADALKKPKEEQYQKNRYLLLSDLLNAAISPQIAPLWDDKEAVNGNMLYQNLKKLIQTYGGKETTVPGATDVYIQPQHSGICSWKVIMACTRTLLKDREKGNYTSIKLNFRYHALLDEMAGLLGISGGSEEWQLLKTNPEKLTLSDAVIDKIALHHLRPVEHAIANIGRSIEKKMKKKASVERIIILANQLGQVKQLLDRVKNRKLELIENQEKKRIKEAIGKREGFERKRDKEKKHLADSGKPVAVAVLDFSLFGKDIEAVSSGGKKEEEEKHRKEAIWKIEPIKGETFIDKIKNLEKYISFPDKPLTPVECVFAIEQCLGEEALLTEPGNLIKQIKDSKESAELLQTVLKIIHQYNLAVAQGDRIPYANRIQICLKLYLFVHLVAQHGFMEGVPLNHKDDLVHEKYSKIASPNLFFILLNEKQLDERLALNKMLNPAVKGDISEEEMRCEGDIFHQYARFKEEFVNLMKAYAEDPLVKQKEAEKLGESQGASKDKMTDISLAIYYFINMKNGEYPGASLPEGMEKFAMEFDQLIVLDKIKHEVNSMMSGRSADIYFDSEQALDANNLYSSYFFDWAKYPEGSRHSGKQYLQIEQNREVTQELDPQRLEEGYKLRESLPSELLYPEIHENSITIGYYNEKTRNSLYETRIKGTNAGHRVFFALEFIKTHFGLLEKPNIQFLILSNLFGLPGLHDAIKDKPQVLGILCGYIEQACRRAIKSRPMSEQEQFLLKIRAYLLKYLYTSEDKKALEYREQLSWLDEDLEKQMKKYLNIKNPSAQELVSLGAIAESLMMSRGLVIAQKNLPETLENDEITYLLSMLIKQQVVSDTEQAWAHDKYLEGNLIFKASSSIMKILEEAALRQDKEPENKIKAALLPVLGQLGIKVSSQRFSIDLPYLSFDNYTLNLGTGILTQAGKKVVNIPPKVTKHPVFQQYFGKKYIGKGVITRDGESVRFIHQGSEYQFSIIDSTKATIKRNLDIHGKPQWYTFCDYARKGKLDLKGLPFTLLDKRFEYWMCNKAGHKHMVVLENQESRYHFDFKKNALSLMKDGKVTPYILQNNQALSDSFPDVFNQLKNFESLKFIEIYRNYNDPEDWLVKLPRYNLSFAFRDGKWICQEKPDCYLETVFLPTRLDQLHACLHLKPLGKSDTEWVVAPRQRFRAKRTEKPEDMSTLAENEYCPIYLDRAGEIYQENDCTKANEKSRRDVEISSNPSRHHLHGTERYVLYVRKGLEVEAISPEDRSHLAYLYMGLRDHKKAYEELLKLSVSTEKPSLETFENLRRIMESVPEVTASAGGQEEEAAHSAEVIAARQLALSILFRLQARFPEVLKLDSQEVNAEDLSAKTKKFQDQRTIEYAGEKALLSKWFNHYADYVGIKHNIPADLRLNEEIERIMLIRCKEYFPLSEHANVNYRYHQLQLAALVKMKEGLLARPHSAESERAFISQLDKEITDHQRVAFKREVLNEVGGEIQREKKIEIEEVRVKPYKPPAPLTLEVRKIRGLKGIEKAVFGESFGDYLLREPPIPLGVDLPSFTRKEESEHLTNLKKEIDSDLLKGAEIARQELNKAEKAKLFFGEQSGKGKIEIFYIWAEEKIKELSASLKKEEEEIIGLLNKAPLEGTEERLEYDLAKLGRTRKTLTLADAFDLFLQNDINYYKEKTGLSEQNCRVLHREIFSYLQDATHNQHLKRISEVLNNDALSEAEKHAKLGVLLTQKRAFKPWDHPDLLLFEYLDDKRLSKKQADYLASLSGEGAHPYQTVQLIMGGGKSKVLNPLLALRFADGLHLAMLVVPQALINTNFEDLSETALRLFGKNVRLFTFSREMKDTLAELKKIENRFLEAISAREPIITTPESLQSLELKYLELLDMPEIDQERVRTLERILLILKNRTVPIVDEVDKTLSVKRQLNYTIGAGERVEPHLCQANLALYEFLRLVPLGKEAAETSLLEVASGKFPPPPRVALGNRMADLAAKLCREATSPLKPILDKLTEEERESLEAYLTEKSKNTPSFILEKLDSKEKDVVALYKEQICRILPETLLKKHNVDYGAALGAGLSGAEAEVAIPFDNGEPNPRSRFSNYIISMNYTIQTNLSKPLTDTMLAAFLRPFAEKIALEKEVGIGGVTQKSFEDDFGPWEEVAGLKPGDARLKEIYDRLRENKKVQLYCLQHYILPEIRQNKKTLSSNAQSFVSLFSNRFVGFSGTDWNYRCYHLNIHCEKDVSQGTDGQTLYHLLRKKLPEIYSDSDEQSGRILTEEQVMSRLLGSKKPGKTQAFIDLGAFGANQSNIDFVRLEEFQEKLKKEEVEFILFFDSGKLQALSLKDGNIIPLGQTDKKYIQEKLGVGPDKWFTYYDTPRTVGTDITQAENARAVLSIDKNSSLRDLLQAVMRMRKLSEEQQIDYLVPEAVRKFYPDVKKWNVEAILKMVVQNQVKKLSEDILASAFHKMDDILRSKVMDKLLSAGTQEKRNKILEEFKDIVYQIETKSCHDQYGNIDKERPVKKVLEEKAEMVKRTMERLLEGDDDRKLVMEKVEKDLDKIINKDTLPFVAPQIFAAEKLSQQQATSETQKEAQKESQKESEKEQEMQKQAAKGYRRPLSQKKWVAGSNKLKDALRLSKNYSREALEKSGYRSPSSIEIYPLEKYMSSKKPPFGFDNNIYVSENFALRYEGQEPYFDDYAKNIHFILNVYDEEQETVKMMVISIEEAVELEDILFKGGSSSSMWIESPIGDVYSGEKPEKLPVSYYNQIQQINYLAGNLGYIYENLGKGKATWLQQDAAEKMNFYKENIAPLRADRPQIVETLTSRLLRIAPSATPVIFSKRERGPERKADLERKLELEQKVELERKVALEGDQVPPPALPVLPQFGVVRTKESTKPKEEPSKGGSLKEPPSGR